MPRMKLDDKDFNVKQLDVEYERSDFRRYEGEVPRTGTILIHRVTKVWFTFSSDGTSAFKVLAVAEKNTGSKAEYNGLPTWDFLTFKPEAAFRYMPFLDTFGLTVKDVKFKMDVAADDDQFGTPVNSIADWEVGSDDALCKIVVKNDPEYGAKVDREGWLVYEPEPEEEERPTRGRSNGARSAASSSRGAAATRRTRPEPEPEEDEDEDDEYDDIEEDDEDIEEEDVEEDEEAEDEDEEEEAPPARPARVRGSRPPARTTARSARSASGSSGSRRAAPAASRSARDGRRESSSASANRAAARDRKNRGSNDEPPF